MRITFFGTQKFERALYTEANQRHQHQLQFLEEHLTPEKKFIIPNTDVACCFVNDKIDRAVIDAMVEKQVKLIALRSAGFNNVDCQYALDHNIKVCRVPAYSPFAVAEYAVAMILSLNRKVHRAYNRVKESDFSLHGLMGFDLNGTTVGVIGTGKIGVIFAKIMLGFGCKVIAYDPEPDNSCVHMGVEYRTLDQLFSEAAIISLHCPLTPATRHIIDEAAIAKMQPGVMIINTGRGLLIDSKAAIAGLKSKQIGHLGLDVYEEEEKLFFEDHSDEIIDDDVFYRLLTFPNVLITGHQAFFTRQAVNNIVNTTLENISHFERGHGTVHHVGEQ